MGVLEDLQPKMRRKASLGLAAFHVEFPSYQRMYRFSARRERDRSFVATCVAVYRHRPGGRRRAMRWPDDAIFAQPYPRVPSLHSAAFRVRLKVSTW